LYHIYPRRTRQTGQTKPPQVDRRPRPGALRCQSKSGGQLVELACAGLLFDEIPSMKTVAILGASADRNKYGNKAVRAFQRQGYTVYPVNPKESEIEGLPVYPSITAVPVRPEIVSVYLR